MPTVLWTPEEIDAWDHTSSEGVRLKASSFANLSRAVTANGSTITLANLDKVKDDSVAAMACAALYAGGAGTAYKNKAIAYLNAVKNVRSFEVNSTNQTQRLRCGWITPNLCKAAALVDYADDGFELFLRLACLPILDWPANANWHASFADAQLAMGAYLQDFNIYFEGQFYMNVRLRQSTYWKAQDDNNNPLLGTGHVIPITDNPRHDPSVGTISVFNTQQNWGASSGAGIIPSSLAATYNGVQLPNGINGEARRDLGHVSMSLGAYMHCIRAIAAIEGTVSAIQKERLRLAYDFHGTRVLQYMNFGTFSSFTPITVPGGPDYKQGWFGAKKLFGVDTPSSVVSLCAHSQVTGYAAAGANHLVCEAFCDG